MRRTTTAVIIGAGHAGLAMSRCLSERGIDHVLLERGEVANSWKRERWDSLRLLTPNWMSRLPGYQYQGSDPNGYRTLSQTIGFIERYAETMVSAPIYTHTQVRSVTRRDGGYAVVTNQGTFRCRAVVVASGACNIANVPACAEGLPSDLFTITSRAYRNPSTLPEGGVLVVGASSSGTQIADELQRSGRQVTLSVGEHLRAPRDYRGRDIQWWLDAAGVYDERFDEMENLSRARSLASIQLVGSPSRRTLDLNVLGERGVKLVGRLAGMRDGVALFSGSLANMCKLSDLKLERLLDRIDEYADRTGLASAVEPSHRFEPTRLPSNPPMSLDLRGGGEIKSVVWATGFRPDHSWIDVDVFDRRGRMRHDGGVVDAPGMYIMGLPVLRTRRSTFIDGAAADARALSAHMSAFLAVRQAA
ncbi:MAG: NAD(P)-binding domain-containing protein [Myxococcales bacterium]|nr:NAD(P)-binding domain-containing protein [Myxococcales bacterium]